MHVLMHGFRDAEETMATFGPWYEAARCIRLPKLDPGPG